MFPLDLANGLPIPPPTVHEPDPDDLGEKYPGYAKFVPCGQDREDDEPWEHLLSEEIAYLFKTKE